MASEKQQFVDAVASKFVPVYASSYGEVKEQFQEKYRGNRWRGELAKAMVGRQEGVKAKDDKPYLAARRAIERHETGEYKNFKEQYGEKIREVGKTLQPIGKKLPDNQLTMTISGWHGKRKREWTVTFKGADAYAFAEDPNYLSFFYEYDRQHKGAEYVPSGVASMFFEADDSGALTDVSVS